MINKTLSNDDYHNHPAISHSGIMRFLHNPNSYHTEYVLGKREETQPMKIGTLLHQAIMEPDVFSDNHIVQHKYTGTGSVAKNKEWLDEQEVSGKTIVTQEHLTMIETMTENFKRSEFLMDSLSAGNIEHSFFFDVESVEAKTSPDFYKPKVAFDIKSTADIGNRGFSKSIHDYGYHVQAAMVIDGLQQNGVDIDKFVIVAFEKKYPYTMTQFIISDRAIGHGRVIYQNAITEIQQNNINHLWEVPNEIDLPDYAYEGETLL